MAKKQEQGNIVRIGKKPTTEIYEHAILRRMHPRIYNRYGCIIIQTVASRLEYTDVVISRFRAAGLNEIKRQKKKVKTVSRTGESYTLPDAYEITLKKIPVLEMQEDEEED